MLNPVYSLKRYAPVFLSLPVSFNFGVPALHKRSRKRLSFLVALKRHALVCVTLSSEAPAKASALKPEIFG